jgi:hypothetical protein
LEEMLYPLLVVVGLDVAETCLEVLLEAEGDHRVEGLLAALLGDVDQSPVDQLRVDIALGELEVLPARGQWCMRELLDRTLAPLGIPVALPTDLRCLGVEAREAVRLIEGKGLLQLGLERDLAAGNLRPYVGSLLALLLVDG